MGERQVIEHDAFAVVGLYRVSGERPLFRVDYPQGNYIELRIKRAKLEREGAHEFVFGQEEIVSVAMSEVQFARLVASFNIGDGVPCTLNHYTDPRDGRFKAVKLDQTYAASPELFAKDIHGRADTAFKAVDAVRDELAELLRQPGSPRKRDLERLASSLDKAQREFVQNAPTSSRGPRRRSARRPRTPRARWTPMWTSA